jgi:hypothetical protein
MAGGASIEKQRGALVHFWLIAVLVAFAFASIIYGVRTTEKDVAARRVCQ